jgi:hypothetical protein
MAASIEVSRPKGKGFRHDIFRRYEVLVDGSKVAAVKEGETAKVGVEPGTHRVQAPIDWAETPAIEATVGPEDSVRFVVRPGGTPVKGRWQALDSPDSYLILERD